MTKKVGIITFHNSYNCGSMLESYAMQTSVSKFINNTYVKIINFSNEGQRNLYSNWYKKKSIKNFIKNFILLPHQKVIKINNSKYEEFKNKFFNLTNEYREMSELNDSNFNYIISGSDQIWNITIDDSDDAYFLPWVHNAKKIAYAPSFGAKNISKYSNNVCKYQKFLKDYDFLSVREYNGQKWIKDLINVEVPVVLDPTLLLEKNDYKNLIANDIDEKEKYIFFYSPTFDIEICKFIKKIADKYKIKVITWSAKSYYVKFIKRFGFKLAKYENPSSYLYYIKNAEIVFTTSFHGTIFSTIYEKNFYTIKNGGMYGDDDRVKTLLNQIQLEKRLIPYKFDESYDYLETIDYKKTRENIEKLKEKSINYLKESLK